MADAAILARHDASIEQFDRLIATGSPTSRLVEYKWGSACVAPSSPRRSIINGVTVNSGAGADMLADYDGLAQQFAGSGISAWAVWLYAHDTATSAELAKRGHVLDSQPVAMAADLNSIEIDLDGDVNEVWDSMTLSSINERAYRIAEGDFSQAIGAMPQGPGTRMFFAANDSENVSCVLTHDYERTCGVYFVATLKEARGSGYATRLMRHALARSREAGCDLAVLQASTMGAPIYERMGFESIGQLQLWEWRDA